VYYIPKCPLKIGDLVMDNNPFKAPELFYGYGIVIVVLNENYVMVHWINCDSFEAVDIGYLEVINE